MLVQKGGGGGGTTSPRPRSGSVENQRDLLKRKKSTGDDNNENILTNESGIKLKRRGSLIVGKNDIKNIENGNDDDDESEEEEDGSEQGDTGDARRKRTGRGRERKRSDGHLLEGNPPANNNNTKHKMRSKSKGDEKIRRLGETATTQQKQQMYKKNDNEINDSSSHQKYDKNEKEIPSHEKSERERALGMYVYV